MSSIKAHLHALEERHARLETEIHQAYQHHQPVVDLKKQKLLVKEELEEIRRRLSNDN